VNNRDAGHASSVLRAALTVDEACRSLGLGRTRFYQEVKANRLRVIKSGRRTVVPVAELHAWIDRALRSQNRAGAEP
jgi:excisionase family DNA binding protein